MFQKYNDVADVLCRIGSSLTNKFSLHFTVFPSFLQEAKTVILTSCAIQKIKKINDIFKLVADMPPATTKLKR